MDLQSSYDASGGSRSYTGTEKMVALLLRGETAPCFSCAWRTSHISSRNPAVTFVSELSSSTSRPVGRIDRMASLQFSTNPRLRSRRT